MRWGEGGGEGSYVVQRLQMVMNARLVVNVVKLQHIMSILLDVLHWLLVTQLIEYKTAMITFSCIRGTRPSSVIQCLPCRVRSRQPVLSSSRWPDCVVYKNHQYWSQKFFSISEPVIWNSLPIDVHSSSISRRQFSSGLKTTCSSRPELNWTAVDYKYS